MDTPKTITHALIDRQRGKLTVYRERLAKGPLELPPETLVDGRDLIRNTDPSEGGAAHAATGSKVPQPGVTLHAATRTGRTASGPGSVGA